MMARDESAVRAEARQVAYTERLLSLAEQLDIPIQRAYYDGPPPPWPVAVVVYEACAGLGPGIASADFRKRQELRERDTVRDMDDGLLVTYIGRLRRQIVMAGEDDLTGWALDWIRERFQIADGELSWRRRAAQRGAPDIDRQVAWRDRVTDLKERVDLGMLIAYECAEAKPVGNGKWQCCCPFHEDRSPSLSIDTAKGLWHCHGCNVGGDAFTYVELRYGLDFAAAVRHLEQRL